MDDIPTKQKGFSFKLSSICVVSFTAVCLFVFILIILDSKTQNTS